MPRRDLLGEFLRAGGRNTSDYLNELCARSGIDDLVSGSSARPTPVHDDLLATAGLIRGIHRTTASGLPLGALVPQEKFKLLFMDEPWKAPSLYYWERDAKSSSPEVDYVTAAGSSIVPIEVKSGKTGTLRSMHRFNGEKHSPLGVRLCSGYPHYDGRILGLPLYLVSAIPALVKLIL